MGSQDSSETAHFERPLWGRSLPVDDPDADPLSKGDTTDTQLRLNQATWRALYESSYGNGNSASSTTKGQ